MSRGQRPKREPMPHVHKQEIVIVVGLFLFACSELVLVVNGDDASVGVVAALLLFAPLVGFYLFVSLSAVQRLLRATASTGTRASVCMALLVTAIAGYCRASGQPVVAHAFAYAVYLFAPLLILKAWPRVWSGTDRAAHRPIRQLLAAVFLWLPLSQGWLRLRLAGGFDASHLGAVAVAMYLFLIIEPLDNVGYTFTLPRRDWLLAGLAFLVFTTLALPMGLGTGFLLWHPRLSADNVAASPLRIYLATAIPEEFLFRGVIQNLAARRFGHSKGLLLAAVVFGLAHPPDLRYMVLASLAGVAYGWVYDHTGHITASALTHAAVDGVWQLLFRR
jgi:membrane protease YdiL (CAAX protease family)